MGFNTIGNTVSMVEYKKLQEVATETKKENRSMRTILENAKSFLDSRPTGSNISNAVSALLSIPSGTNENAKGYVSLQKYVVDFIFKNAKNRARYSGMVKAKCERDKITYKGLDNTPAWLIFDAFKERAIVVCPDRFALLFREAVLSFILSQQTAVPSSIHDAPPKQQPTIKECYDEQRSKLLDIIGQIGKHFETRMGKNDLFDPYREIWKQFKWELKKAHGIDINARKKEHLYKTGKEIKTSESIHDDELLKSIDIASSIANTYGVKLAT